MHTGAAGTGQAAKIVNNLILAVCLAGTSEGLLLAERLGLDAGVFYDIAVNSTPWRTSRYATGARPPRWCPPRPARTVTHPGFSATLLLKDLTLALQEGQNTSTALDTARTVHALYATLVDDGGGQYDCTALLPALREGRDSAHPIAAAADAARCSPCYPGDPGVTNEPRSRRPALAPVCQRHLPASGRGSGRAPRAPRDRWPGHVVRERV